MINFPGEETIQTGVIVSARAEWDAVTAFFNPPELQSSPFGEYFYIQLTGIPCVFLHGGWGKVSAAASTQYIIDRWNPGLLLNIGTCGGLAGQIHNGEIVLASETFIYDIYERMSDPNEALDFYATPLDLSFLCEPLPQVVRIGRLVSADQDIDTAMVGKLIREFGAFAADWESGAIAWTAARNKTKVLILRAVSDIVSATSGELYKQGDFASNAREVMQPLLSALPEWLRCAILR